jgi:enamine deaminase RidA (YjgF/YER057c/UK114 family)
VTGERVAARLAELGLELPSVAAPVAAYVPAVVDGELVWTSGQLPFIDGQLPATGLVGEGEGLVPPEDAARLARVCALNALAAIGSVADLDRVARIVKVVGFVASAPGFSGQPQVVNGASALLGDVFGDVGRHARSAVGVAALPLGAPVEVEVVAALSRPAPGSPR